MPDNTKRRRRDPEKARAVMSYSPLDDDNLIQAAAATGPSPAPAPADELEASPDKVVAMPQSATASSSPDPTPPPEKTPKTDSPPAPKAASSEDTSEFKTRVSRTDIANFKRLTAALADDLGTTLDHSNMIRAVVSILIGTEEGIRAVAQEEGSIGDRPSNKDRVAMAEFDSRLEDIIRRGLQRRRVRRGSQ